MSFMNDEFLLKNDIAKQLYKYAENMPIFDYHCHLSPKEIFENRAFYNLTELWLEGDHYKWRIMRQFGIGENFITGNSPPYQKFLAFCTALPSFIANPVYDWAHLELKKYFGITVALDESTALEVWKHTEAMMKGGDYTARSFIEKSAVHTLITTDDPIDNLAYHQKLRQEKLGFNVLPCFRLDNILNIEKEAFEEYIKNFEVAVNGEIKDYTQLLAAIDLRLHYFIQNGAVSSDCSIINFPKGEGDCKIADKALKKRLSGKAVSADELQEYKFCLLRDTAKLFAKNNFVMQLHIGAIRDINSLLFERLGADCGNDSIGNAIAIEKAGMLFDEIERNVGMPKTICYTHNPNSYYPLATMLGNFAGGVCGKTQLGAAWWLLDHECGIEKQLDVFATTGGLGYFNGMLTDSRSFTSYARHDYFRRILCRKIGEWVEAGKYPFDEKNLKKMIENICFYNAKNFFERGENL